jgi:hypothetical protein
MTYILKWTNTAKTPIILEDGAVNTISTSLTLTGRGYIGWGQPLQENQIHLLENFASGTPPSTFILGQTWFNSDSGHLNVNIGPSSSNWSELAFRNIAIPPTHPIPGDTWYDTTYNVLNVYSSAGPNRLAYQTDVKQGNYSVDVGVANAYQIALNPAISVYANNIIGSFKVTNANTGVSTLDAGGGPRTILNNHGVPLIAGDLVAGAILSYIYVLTDDVFYITSDVTSQTSPPVSNQNLTFGPTINWNVKLGAASTVILTGNSNIAAPTNLYVGSFIMIIEQDAVGSRTVTWDPIFKFPSGVKPVLSTTPNSIDICSFYSDGTHMYGSYLRGVA